MTPVEATNTSEVLTPRASPVRCAVFSASFIPFRPLQAFAFPLFATIARTVRPFSTSMSRSTGAAFTLFFVNTAAEVAGTSE